MPPTYHPVKNDGADFRCSECQQLFPHTQVWLIRLPSPAPSNNRMTYVLCKECVDEDWLKLATKGDPV